MSVPIVYIAFELPLELGAQITILYRSILKVVDCMIKAQDILSQDCRRKKQHTINTKKDIAITDCLAILYTA